MSKRILTLSGLEPFELRSNLNFVNVGERTNVTGSRKFLKLIKENKYNEAVEIAMIFKAHGCDLIDVSAGQTTPDSRPIYGRMFQTWFSEQVRLEANIPTIAVGNITTWDQINTILAAGRADFVAREKSLLPICILGANDPVGIDFTGKVASAQVKSAILIAGLNAIGETRYIESVHTRDHTERMLSTFGAEVEISQLTDSKCINIKGLAQLDPQEISIPGDPSSAAFPMCAALMVNGSEITIPNICQNPTRIGLQETLCEMGADISVENKPLIPHIILNFY